RLPKNTLLAAMGFCCIATLAQPPAVEDPQPAFTASADESAVRDMQSRFREVLALADWDESRLSKFADGETITIDEQLELWRFVERLGTLDPVWLDRRQGL